MDNQRRFPLILSSFWLKIIALLTMTIDHVGYMLEPMTVGVVFRYIGRLALPLFVFMIVEGAIHTKNFKKYALRLGVMAGFISLAILLSEVIPFFKNNGFSMRDEGNIFIDLLLCAVAVYLLRQDKWYLKLLALLPLAFGITSFIVSAYECVGCGNIVYWFPFFIRTQYGFYAVLMALLFYGATLLTKAFSSYHSSITGVDKQLYVGSNFERHVNNIFSVFAIIIATFVLYFVCKNMPSGTISLNIDVQLIAMVSGAFILLYNGERGYNKKWFQYGSYFYYIVHLAVIYLVFYLITLI